MNRHQGKSKIREIEEEMLKSGNESSFSEQLSLIYKESEVESSWHPGKSEPTVMDEETLMNAARDQAIEDRIVGITKAEDFNQVLKLTLEYKDILMIDNLWDFTSLTQLCLNNNLIERIEGLDRLCNLTWLNLSFNRIRKIEGLESLQKLEVLNMSNNKISVIENMDKLEKLTHFIIANNLIEQLDNVLYLRRFKNLFTITISGNPFSTADDYKLFIAAYFPNLTCIDYRIINEKTRNEASIKYKYALEEMRRKELEEQQVMSAEQRSKAELQLHTDAFVEFLNGPYLFNSMFEDDPKAGTLHCMPEVTQLLQTFESQIGQLCTQLFEIGLDEHKQRETEVNAFLGAQDRTVKEYQQEVSEILADFEQQHKERIKKLRQFSDPDKVNHWDHCNDEVNQLCKSLMSLEFHLVSQVEDIIKRLDDSISDMVVSFSETVQGIFAQCRDLEDNYNENVQKIAAAALQKVAMDKEGAVSDDIRMLTVMDALAAGHDNHLMKINDRETLLVTRLNAWKASLFKEIQEKELKRNRLCLSDIHRYAFYLKEQLKELQQQ